MCGRGAVDEVVRARDAYGLSGSRLVVLTTASSFSKAARKRAEMENALLVAREDLTRWGMADI